MRSFSCPTCRHLVFFENFGCLNCGTQLGYHRAEHILVAIDAAAPDRCANAEIADCNWVRTGDGPLCWLPLTYALNAVNRSMGKEDLYPFYLSAEVLEKLRFVHDAVRGRRNPVPARASLWV